MKKMFWHFHQTLPFLLFLPKCGRCLVEGRAGSIDLCCMTSLPPKVNSVKEKRLDHQNLHLRSTTPQGRNCTVWLLCACIHEQMPEHLCLTASLAQERQEHFQKIVLEGTERMEDQVRAFGWMHMAHHCKTIWLHQVTVEVGAASYFWDPGRCIGLANNDTCTVSKVSEDRMMEAVIKPKENIFHHFRGKVEICEELPFRKGNSLNWTWSSVKVAASIESSQPPVKVVFSLG